MSTVQVPQPRFGQRLRDRRVEVGMSQRDLAGDLVTPGYISLLERGERVPTLDVVVQLARSLRTSLRDLLGPDATELLSMVDTASSGQLVSRIEVRNLLDAGDLAEAAERLAGEVATARDRGTPEELAERELSLLSVLAASGRPEQQLELLNELLELAPVRGSEETSTALSIDRVSVLRELGRLSESLQEALKLRNRGPELIGAREYVRLLGVLVSVWCEVDEPQSAAPVVAELLSRAEAAGQPGLLGRAHWVASIAYARMGRPADARTQLAAARQCLSYATMPIRDWLRFCRSTAAVLLEIGEPDQARGWIEVAESTATMTGIAAELAAARRERASYELAVGNPAGAADLFGALADDATITGLDLVNVLLGLGEALAEIGRDQPAIEALRRAAHLCEASGNFRRATEAWRRIDELHRPAGGSGPATSPPAKPRPAKSRPARSRAGR